MIALELADVHDAHLPQDATTRVWDMRMLNRSLCLLRSSVGAVRSLRFSPCGSILAAAESIDFVRLYDVDADFSRCGVKCGPGEVSMRVMEPRVCLCKLCGLLLRCKLDVWHAQEPGDRHVWRDRRRCIQP